MRSDASKAPTFPADVLHGLLIALAHSFFIYATAYGILAPWLFTVTGLLSLYGLLRAAPRVWFFSGFLIGTAWFWWIALSFKHYALSWAIPLVILAIGVLYGTLFFIGAILSRMIAKRLINRPFLSIEPFIKAIWLFMLGFIHPFGFDWYKPELIFTLSFIGISAWRFALVLLALSLLIATRKIIVIVLLVGAIDISLPCVAPTLPGVKLIGTHTTVEKKWDPSTFQIRFTRLLRRIKHAQEDRPALVILPESVFPVFLHRTPNLYGALQTLARRAPVVVGALSHLDDGTPVNAAYVFHSDGNVTVAPKVVLVPFGEANPLPDFLSRIVNRVIYDDAVDYAAASHFTDVRIGNKPYRTAICYEATSKRAYEPPPKRLIVLSNNAWFTPSIEPTLQKLLLIYYARKYGTRIYHVANMSPSYVILPPKECYAH